MPPNSPDSLVIPKLEFLLREALDSGDILGAVLCSPSTAFHPLVHGAWDCGYRNAQTLMSPYAASGHPAASLTTNGWKSLIHDAWAHGYDPQGAAHFHSHLGNKWIGASDVCAALSYAGVDARLCAFPRLPRRAPAAIALSRYFHAHFSFGPHVAHSVTHTHTPPLFVQHSGHSRSLVGIELLPSGDTRYLFYDKHAPIAHIPLHKLHSDTPQLNRMRLKPFRVSLQDLKKHDMYETLEIHALDLPAHVHQERKVISYDVLSAPQE